jgi:hypothetical protein
MNTTNDNGEIKVGDFVRTTAGRVGGYAGFVSEVHTTGPLAGSISILLGAGTNGCAQGVTVPAFTVAIAPVTAAGLEAEIVAQLALARGMQREQHALITARRNPRRFGQLERDLERTWRRVDALRAELDGLQPKP